MEFNVTIENFRSIKSTQVSLRSGVNILIGPNGSGKTCLLSALKFVRDVMFRGAGLAVAKGGGAKRTYRRGESQMKFSIEYDLGMRIYLRKKVPYRLKWDIVLSQKGSEKIATIVSECILICALYESKEIRVFELDVNRENLAKPKHSVHFPRPDKVGKDILISPYGTSNQSKSQIIEELKRNVNKLLKTSKKLNDEPIFTELAWFDRDLRRLSSFFRNLNEYNIIPNIARQSTDQLPMAEMLPNGENLSEVIYALVNRSTSMVPGSRLYDLEQEYQLPLLPGRYMIPRRFGPSRAVVRGSPSKQVQFLSLKDVLDNINSELSAGVSPIDSVSAQIDPTNGKRFVVFRAGKHTFYPEEVSDGTIKWLCILVSIYVPFSTIYLLEEPENFLHPWMQQRLISIMREQALTNETVFLLTTHSSTILNSAHLEEVTIVSQRTKEGTKMSRAHDSDEIKRFLMESNFGLGDLWVSGAIGGIPGEK